MWPFPWLPGTGTPPPPPLRATEGKRPPRICARKVLKIYTPVLTQAPCQVWTKCPCGPFQGGFLEEAEALTGLEHRKRGRKALKESLLASPGACRGHPRSLRKKGRGFTGLEKLDHQPGYSIPGWSLTGRSSRTSSLGSPLQYFSNSTTAVKQPSSTIHAQWAGAVGEERERQAKGGYWQENNGGRREGRDPSLLAWSSILLDKMRKR